MTIKSITEKLKKYGIRYNREKGYEAKYFHEIKYALHFLDNSEFLPILEERLDLCVPSDLVYMDTNALMWSMKFLSYDKLRLLAKKPDFIEKFINAADDDGRTAFHYFADNTGADARTMELLIELGADINATDKHKWTALHHFAYRENDDCAHALFRYKPKIIANGSGHTPADIERMGSDWEMPSTGIWEYEERVSVRDNLQSGRKNIYDFL